MKEMGRKLLRILLMVAMVIGLLPGMGLTAYADNTETLLTTITATGKEQAIYSTEGVATVSFSYTAGGSSAYYADWGWWGYGWTATVTPAKGYTITKCVFYDDKDRTATDSEAPFEVKTTEEDKTPQVNGTPILANQSKGIKKIEVYYATYSVTVTPGDNMTKTTGSGDAEQTGLIGPMTDVVYTADKGYYFPTDYSVAEVSGIKVTRDSYTQITVSGKPTADATITLTAPTAKTTPAAPTTASAVDCTTSDNNDGKLTGVTTAMEYKKSDADSWIGGTGSDITDLVPGTYYVRVKATDTTNASGNQELTVKGFISYTVTFKVVNGKWNEGEDDAATADKTVTLTGHDGDTLKLTADQIPAVGSKPNDTYKAGSWDVTPSAETAITEATTYTYTYVAKEAAVVTKAPEAKTLTYTGDPQELVTAGTAEGGTMYYALGTDSSTAPDASAYKSSIPTAINPGTYYVWYMTKGDDEHYDSTPVKMSGSVTIKPGYAVKDGNNQTWIKGSGKNLTISFKALGEVDNAYEKYGTNGKIQVDGIVVDKSNYDTSKGSLVVELKSSYLETLSVGEYKITAVFEDGEATGMFKVKEKSSSEDSSEKKSSTPKKDNVVTCQMAGYPANYAWNEAAKSCQAGYLDANGVFHSTAKATKVPNTYDKGLTGNMFSLFVAMSFAFIAACLLRKY